MLFEARSTHVWRPNPLPDPALSSEGVGLLDNPVIQRVARKYSKSPAQVGGGCRGWGGGHARIPWEPGSGRRKGSHRLARGTPARSSLGSLAPRAVLPHSGCEPPCLGLRCGALGPSPSAHQPNGTGKGFTTVFRALMTNV